MKSVRSGCFLLVILVLVISPALGQAPKASAGQAIFKAKCTLCHGTDGTGKTTLGQQLKASDLRSVDVQKQPDAALKEIITHGKSNMPGFESQLSGDDLSDVLTYVRQLGKKAKTVSTPAQK